MANTTSAKKATRKIARRTAVNKSRRTHMRGAVRTVEYKDETPPADAVPPMAELPPHAADLGMTFYNGKMFPDSYKGGIFIAEHGSWNRTQPIGARVMFA